MKQISWARSFPVGLDPASCPRGNIHTRDLPYKARGALQGETAMVAGGVDSRGLIECWKRQAPRMTVIRAAHVKEAATGVRKKGKRTVWLDRGL